MTHKQWLILYPVGLSVIKVLAFFAIYSAEGRPISWSDFIRANFEVWRYVQDNFLRTFSLRPALGIALFCGFALCAFSAMLRAPLFRAIVGPSYPLAPKNFREFAQLSLFYLLSYAALWLVPVSVPAGHYLELPVSVAVYVIAILIVFADYAIVLENLSVIAAIRRSANLLARRWPAVVLLYVGVQVVYYALGQLYASWYQSPNGVFVLVPLSQILLESFIVLFVDLVLVSFYQRLRGA